MLFPGFKKGFYRLPFTVLAQTFKRIFLLIGHKDKVTVVFVRVCDGFVIGNHSGFAAPFFDGKVFLYFFVGGGGNLDTEYVLNTISTRLILYSAKKVVA